MLHDFQHFTNMFDIDNIMYKLVYIINTNEIGNIYRIFTHNLLFNMIAIAKQNNQCLKMYA